MSESTRNPRERRDHFGGGDDPFGGDDALGNLVTVTTASGHEETLPLAGLTVGEIRRRHGPRLQVDRNAEVMVNGRNVADDVTVRSGEKVYFRRNAPEKGHR